MERLAARPNYDFHYTCSSYHLSLTMLICNRPHSVRIVDVMYGDFRSRQNPVASEELTEFLDAAWLSKSYEVVHRNVTSNSMPQQRDCTS